MIKTYKSELFYGKLNVETYSSAQELVKDLGERKNTDRRFHTDCFSDPSWVGATREEAMRMMTEGYQPTVDRMRSAMKFKATGIAKRTKFFNDVAGFQPIVPLALMGVPNSMVNSAIKPIKMKVIDVYYDMTAHCGNSAEDIIAAGEKMLSAIFELEAQGYRFNLYAVQDYTDRSGCDMLCVRVKTASQPFDLKRMSFATSHSAFFRGVGFEWYGKFPIGKYRDGYGTSIAYRKGLAEIQQEFKNLFGRNAVFFSCAKIIEDGEEKDHIKEVLLNAK